MSIDNKESEATPGSQDKLNFKAIAPLLLIVLIDLLGLTVIIPLLPIYAATFGANELTIGILAAIYPMMQFIAGPLLGQLSDKFGRRPMLLISQIGTLIGFLILGFANSLWMIVLSRLIDGISGANIVIAQASISDRTTEKTRTQGMGLIGAAFGVGFVIGPLLAFLTLALSNNNYALVAFMAAGFSLLSTLLTWFLLDESLPAESRVKNVRLSVGFGAIVAALRRKEISFMMLLVFASQFAFMGFEQFFPIFTLNRLGLNGSENAALFVLIGVLLVIIQGGLLGRWSRRFGNRRVILFGLVVLAFGLILSAFTPAQTVPWYNREALAANLTQNTERSVAAGDTGEAAELQVDLPAEGNSGWLGLIWIIVAMFPVTIGASVLQPSVNSLVSQQVAPHEVGNVLGVSASFASIGHVLAPVVYGAIFQLAGSTAPFLFGGVTLLLLWGISQWRLPSQGSTDTVQFAAH
jgi:DHA1 family tetracycline resistance protein-like MFS transporter